MAIMKNDEAAHSFEKVFVSLLQIIRSYAAMRDEFGVYLFVSQYSNYS